VFRALSAAATRQFEVDLRVFNGGSRGAKRRMEEEDEEEEEDSDVPYSEPVPPPGYTRKPVAAAPNPPRPAPARPAPYARPEPLYRPPPTAAPPSAAQVAATRERLASEFVRQLPAAVSPARPVLPAVHLHLTPAAALEAGLAAGPLVQPFVRIPVPETVTVVQVAGVVRELLGAAAQGRAVGLFLQGSQERLAEAATLGAVLRSGGAEGGWLADNGFPLSYGYLAPAL